MKNFEFELNQMSLRVFYFVAQRKNKMYREVYHSWQSQYTVTFAVISE